MNNPDLWPIMRLFTVQTALITGASRGIGAATAKVFAYNGANLVLIARNIKKLNSRCNFHFIFGLP